jgi:hypothetical protein
VTTAHPANPTNPSRPGAPLPEDMVKLPTVQPGDVMAELARAEVELLYAVGRHRKAWAAMRAHQDYRAQKEAEGTPGSLYALDSDPYWKKRTGDVSWWRDEVTCQATAVLALRDMLNADRCVAPAEDSTSVRRLVYGWHQNGRGVAPSDRQYKAATFWKDTAGAKLAQIDRRICDALIRAWHEANPR